MDIPWIVAWDFNQIGKSNEKFGGKTPTFKRCLAFKNHVQSYQLNDLGFHGPKYTWTNRRITNYHSLIKDRLDHFLGNDLWLNLFPETKIHHLFSGASDYIPLILHTYTSRPMKVPSNLNQCGSKTLLFKVLFTIYGL